MIDATQHVLMAVVGVAAVVMTVGAFWSRIPMVMFALAVMAVLVSMWGLQYLHQLKWVQEGEFFK
jgi:hypothetical protein